MLNPTWCGAWHPEQPIAYPSLALVFFRGRVFISVRPVPAETSINDGSYWRMIANTYEILEVTHP